MNSKICVILILFLFGMTLLAGCTTAEQKASELKPSPTTRGDNPADGSQKDTKTGEVKTTTTEPGTGNDEKYYYNIRIIPPATLEDMEREIGTGEYVIRNEDGDLIGIVSPRSLAIRGDLVRLAEESETGGKVFDKTDIATHLVDVAFGIDNAKLQLFKSNKDYQFWFDAYYTEDDVKYILEMAKYLNTLSDTTQFEDEEVARGFLKSNYEEIPYNYYNIKIIPENMLEDFKDERKPEEHLMKDPEGNLIGMVAPDHLYLLETLSDEDRNYYIRRGIFYSMGLHGTTYSEQDSFFVKEIGKNTELSSLDEEAVKLLYGGRLTTGMSLEETRKTLGLDK